MTDSNRTLEELSESTEPLERRINQYQANLKHIDELLARAQAGAASMPEVRAQVVQAQSDRDRVSAQLEKLRGMSSEAFSEQLIEKSGPMGLWDVVAEDLEKLVERIERR